MERLRTMKFCQNNESMPRFESTSSRIWGVDFDLRYSLSTEKREVCFKQVRAIKANINISTLSDTSTTLSVVRTSCLSRRQSLFFIYAAFHSTASIVNTGHNKNTVSNCANSTGLRASLAEFYVGSTKTRSYPTLPNPRSLRTCQFGMQQTLSIKSRHLEP
jgi:hypothetical protein